MVLHLNCEKELAIAGKKRDGLYGRIVAAHQALNVNRW
jgi:hypothetical protein